MQSTVRGTAKSLCGMVKARREAGVRVILGIVVEDGEGREASLRV